jgi:hypothetical protein
LTALNGIWRVRTPGPWRGGTDLLGGHHAGAAGAWHSNLAVTSLWCRLRADWSAILPVSLRWTWPSFFLVAGGMGALTAMLTALLLGSHALAGRDRRAGNRQKLLGLTAVPAYSHGLWRLPLTILLVWI